MENRRLPELRHCPCPWERQLHFPSKNRVATHGHEGQGEGDDRKIQATARDSDPESWSCHDCARFPGGSSVRGFPAGGLDASQWCGFFMSRSPARCQPGTLGSPCLVPSWVSCVRAPLLAASGRGWGPRVAKTLGRLSPAPAGRHPVLPYVSASPTQRLPPSQRLTKNSYYKMLRNVCLWSSGGGGSGQQGEDERVSPVSCETRVWFLSWFPHF